MDNEPNLNTPFLRKLNHILSESLFSHLICWDSTGTMIDILDQKRIQSEILPKFFRHNKFESFIRQLNLYGFRKIKKTNFHRFRHPDLINGKTLFSIKPQRKNKNIIELSNSHQQIEQIQRPEAFDEIEKRNNIENSGKLTESNYNLNYNLNQEQAAMNNWWMASVQLQMMLAHQPQMHANYVPQLVHSPSNQPNLYLGYNSHPNNIFFYN